MAGLRMPGAMAATWDRATPRERVLLVVAVVVVVGGLFYGLAWPALARDTERTAMQLQRDRATLAYLQALRDPATGSRRGTGAGDASEATPGGTGLTPNGSTGSGAADARRAVEQALAARGLRGDLAASGGRSDAVSLVLAAVPFDALVGLLADLQAAAALRVVEARITARVEPGLVRADLTLGR